MRTYENLFIVHPEVVGEDLTALIDKYRKVLTDQAASVLKADSWGSRALAYPVKKQPRGTYVLFVFEGAPTVVAEFERRMRIDDKVLKYQTVLFEGVVTAPVTEAAAVEEAVPAGEVTPAVEETPAEEA